MDFEQCREAHLEAESGSPVSKAKNICAGGEEGMLNLFHNLFGFYRLNNIEIIYKKLFVIVYNFTLLKEKTVAVVIQEAH